LVKTSQKIDYAAFPAVLVANYGPFSWGPEAEAAAHNAAVLEAGAPVAYFTVRINEQAETGGAACKIGTPLRKHGSNA
jgi:L-ribulose-5-phosphate 4-epimerase